MYMVETANKEREKERCRSFEGVGPVAAWGVVMIGRRAPRCVKTALCAWVEGSQSRIGPGSERSNYLTDEGLRRRRTGGAGVVGWSRMDEKTSIRTLN